MLTTGTCSFLTLKGKFISPDHRNPKNSPKKIDKTAGTPQVPHKPHEEHTQSEENIPLTYFKQEMSHKTRK